MTKSIFTQCTECDAAHSVFYCYYVESVVAGPIP